jgi:hypothetical protein
LSGSLLTHLPSCWRVLVDSTRNTLVLLHDGGLWVEITPEAALVEFDAHAISVLVQAFATAVAEGRVGKHTAWNRAEDGRCVEARLLPVAEEGPRG